jgi:hypothetical protein
VIPNTQVEVGMRDGAGCDPSHFTEDERKGKLVFDNHWANMRPALMSKGADWSSSPRAAMPG